MAQKPVEDVCRIVVLYSLTASSEYWTNVYHAKLAGFGGTEQAALADAVDAAVTDTIKPDLSNAITYVSTTVYDLNTLLSPIVVNTDGAGVGGIAAEPYSIAVAAVVTNYTGARGRSGRGRTYYTGLMETHWTNGALTAPAQTMVLEWHAAIDAAINTAGFDYVLVSRWQNHVELTTPQVYPIGSWAIRSSKSGSQRRRVDRP